jgi:pimeloyl-ACP methyl ester carboxylesterase
MDSPSPLDGSRPSNSSSASSSGGSALAYSAQGEQRVPGAPLVLLHELTLDRRAWDSVLDALPSNRCAIAFDLPGHGSSAALSRRGLYAVADAIHAGVVGAGLRPPVVIGHSTGGELAAIYAARYPAAAVVSVNAPVRLEPFARLLRSLRPQLAGDGFAEAWAMYRDSWHTELLSAADRLRLELGERSVGAGLRELVLSYHSDLLEGPLEEAVDSRAAADSVLRVAGTPYLALHSRPLDRSDAAWLRERLPQTEILVWPVGHHFPHLAHPDRFAALLAGLAAG